MAAAARVVYRNDDTPLSRKLPAAVNLLSHGVSLLDMLAFGSVAVFSALTSPKRKRGEHKPEAQARGHTSPKREREDKVSTTPDLTPAVAPASQDWEARLAELAYESVKQSHI